MTLDDSTPLYHICPFISQWCWLVSGFCYLYAEHAKPTLRINLSRYRRYESRKPANTADKQCCKFPVITEEQRKHMAQIVESFLSITSSSTDCLIHCQNDSMSNTYNITAALPVKETDL